MENELFDTEEEAARAGDRLAELYGEFLREADAKDSAEFQKQELADSIEQIKEEIRSLVAGVRESVLSAPVCAAVASTIRHHRKEISQARTRIKALSADYWLAVNR